MTYNPKLIDCPYKTSDGKCVHKHCEWRRKKKKRFCGYIKPEYCEMYNEWLKLRKVDSKAISDDLKTIGVLTNESK